MSEKRYRLARGANVSLVQLEDVIAGAWAEIQNTNTSAYARAKEIVASPENDVPKDPEDAFAVTPDAQHMDPATGAIIVVTWVGGKIAEKLFDLLWDKVVLPQIEARIGKGNFKQLLPTDSPGQP